MIHGDISPLMFPVGEPINVNKSIDPSQDEIDDLHERYVSKLFELFEENKTKYGLDKSIHLAIK